MIWHHDPETEIENGFRIISSEKTPKNNSKFYRTSSLSSLISHLIIFIYTFTTLNAVQVRRDLK
jgi:hypothetical protein